MSKTHWTKQYRGFYTLDGTDYAVASSFADPAASTLDKNSGAHTDVWATTDTEWAVVRFLNEADRASQDGTNESWHDTMREAKAEAERLANR
jgi:hypothetical protein